MDLDDAGEKRFHAYMEGLIEALRGVHWCGQASTLCAYCTGLLLPNERKSMEPMAARVDPEHVEALHHAMYQFLANSPWPSSILVRKAVEYALGPVLGHGPIEAWILDDTTLPKCGTHSVGVARQYCGALGKVANCQDLVTLSLANHFASIPCAYRLYLPKKWADDPERRRATKIPERIKFRPKWEIGLMLIDAAAQAGISQAPPVLADAGFGDVPEFRRGLDRRGRVYTVGINSNVHVWPANQGPKPPLKKRKPSPGRPRTALRTDKKHPPVDVMTFAKASPKNAWRVITWGEGTEGPMESRFMTAKVRVSNQKKAHGSYRELPKTEWLLVEWPLGESEPTKFWLSTERDDLTLEERVNSAKLRWRVERDYLELKDEIGLDHYEGRRWPGFHHHVALCIAAYAFLVAERARLPPPRLATVLGFKAAALSPPKPWRRPTPSSRTAQSGLHHHREDPGPAPVDPGSALVPLLRTSRPEDRHAQGGAGRVTQPDTVGK
jgi:SRSO17 transposase